MKKFYFFIVLLFTVTSLYAYQGNWGFGISFDLDITGLSTSGTEESTTGIDEKVFFTMMFIDKLEVAPFFTFDLLSEVVDFNTTDGYMYYGIGSMFYWHFLNKSTHSVATGFDIGYKFGNLDTEVYGDNSHSQFDFKIPVIIDLNLVNHVSLRISQEVWQFTYLMMKDESGSDDYYSSTSFSTSNGLSPQFSFIIFF